MRLLVFFVSFLIVCQCRVPPQKGAVFGAEEWSPLFDYTTPEAEQQLIRLKATGADWVRILVTYFQDTVNTTDIYPIPKPNLLATATDDELEYVINLAHAMGFKVMLSPLIDPNWNNYTNHRSGTDQTWRGQIGLYFTDSQWTTWFSNYQKLVGHYATMAQRLGVEQFCIGAELNAPFTHPNFPQVIQKIRSIYTGSLTAAVLYFQATSNQTCNTGINCAITWFNAIDKIGIDAYYHLTNAPESNPTVEQIVEAWQEYVPLIEKLQQQWNKPIIFVEIGYTSAYATHSHPDHMDLLAFDDCSVWALCVFLEEQAKSYEAAYRVFWDKPWFDGMFWWLWRTDPHDGWTSDPGFSPVGKPAEQVMKKWYSG